MKKTIVFREVRMREEAEEKQPVVLIRMFGRMISEAWQNEKLPLFPHFNLQPVNIHNSTKVLSPTEQDVG